MLGNYLQQTTSADDIFRCIFGLGALRVKFPNISGNYKMNCPQFVIDETPRLG